MKSEGAFEARATQTRNAAMSSGFRERACVGLYAATLEDVGGLAGMFARSDAR